MEGVPTHNPDRSVSDGQSRAQREEALRHFIEYAPVAIAMLDADMRYVAESARWRSDFGLGELPLRGRCHYDVFPEIPDHWKAVHRRCLAGAIEHNDEELFVRADGARQWIRWEVQPWRTDAGHVGGLVIFSEEITPRKEAELALRERHRQLQEAKEQLAAVYDRAPFAIALTKMPEATTVDVNEAFLRLFEVTREEVVGKRSTELGITDRGAQAQVAEELRTRGVVRDFEARHRTKSGSMLDLLLNIDNVDIAGHPFTLTTIADITARKRAEAALEETRDQQREQAETMRLLLETAAQGILSVDSNGVIVTTNAAVESMFGWATGELVGQPLERLLPPAARGVHAQHGAAYWAAPRSRPMGLGMDLVGQRKDGSTFSIEVSLNHVATPSGGRVFAFVTDITERVRAAAALRELERRLRLALEAAAETWTWEVEGDRLVRHSAWFGEAGTRVASWDEWVARVHPDERATFLARVDQALKNPQAVHLDIEFRVMGRAESMTWLRSLIFIERNDTGGAVRISGFSLDISDRKRTQEALRRSNEALEERARDLQHQRDQLRRLASDLTLAEQHAREQLAKTLHDHVQQLLFSATLKLDRLSKCSSVSRTTDDSRLLARARDDVDEAIAAARSLAVELFPPLLHQEGLPAALSWLAGRMNEKNGLTVDLSADPRADPASKDLRMLVFESVRELLFNVVKHARIDRAAVDLTLTSDDNVRISVADKGVGFDPAFIFSRTQVHEVGLGLFSIRERVALLGGRLDVTSAPGQGTAFTLLVPRTRDARPIPADTDASSARPASEAPLDRGTDGTRKRPLSILIAGDHALVREGLRELCAERPELRVVGEAADGLEAIAQAHALRPDVIVMDVSMPNIGGVEATRRIRAALPFVTIFGLSRQEQPEGLHAIEQVGAAGYFTKGDDADRLLERLLTLHANSPGSAGQLT